LIAGIISFIYLEATVISIPIRIIFKKSAFTLGYHFNTKREYPYICLYRIRLSRKGNGYEKNAWIKIERGIRWIKISHQAALVLIDAYRQNVGGDPPWIEEI